MPQLRWPYPTSSSDDLYRGCLPHFSLVHGHAKRGVPLDVLNSDKILAYGELDVGHGHIVFEIHPLPGGVADRTDTFSETPNRRLSCRPHNLDAGMGTCWFKRTSVLREPQFTASLREQMQCLTPPTRHEQRVA